MARANRFKGVYEVDDGYVGGSLPKHFDIYEGDIEDDMDELALRCLYQEIMHQAFEKSVCPYEKNEDEFVEWAKQIIATKNG